jgi:hypothetical protein
MIEKTELQLYRPLKDILGRLTTKLNPQQIVSLNCLVSHLVYGQPTSSGAEGLGKPKPDKG